MSRNEQKGLKPLIIKMIAITLSVCYLLGPLHSEVNMFLHEMTHYLEMPDSIMTHTSALGEHQIHLAHDLDVDDEHHHNLLDVFSKVFESFDTEKDNQAPTETHNKIDKHIQTQRSLKKQIFYTALSIHREFNVLQNQTRDGFSRFIDEPPTINFIISSSFR